MVKSHAPADFHYSFGRQVFVNGIIYLHRIIDPRMTGTAVKNLQLLQDLCGNEMKNVLLVTTFWDMVPKAIGDKREMELQTNYWAPLLDLGSRMYRYKHKSSGQEIMQYILSNQSNIIELQLQIELTQAERSLLDTMAGKRLQEGLNHQLEQLEITLNQVQGQRRAIEERRSQGRDERTLVTAHENRILEEISAIERDLEILGLPRYIAMEEIDQKVAEIATERGRDSIDAFWEFYGAVDDENERGMGSPRESLSKDPEPTSPGFKPAGFRDQHFGRRNTERSRQQKVFREDPRSYDEPEEETRDIVARFGNLKLRNEEYNSVEYGGQQVESSYDPHQYDGHEVDGRGHSVDQNMGRGNNPSEYGQRHQTRADDNDDYDNPRRDVGGYRNQYRRGSRGY
jgi:hypothetical protein